MNRGHLVNFVICLLLSIQFILIPQPLQAVGGTALQLIDDDDAIYTAWSLPNLLYEGTIQGRDQCIRAAFAASQYSRSLTGTLTYAPSGDVTYKQTPRDRVSIVYANGLTIDFVIADIQGYFDGGADGFLNSDYHMRCRATVARQSDLTVDATRRGSEITFTTVGTLRFGETTFQVDTQGTSNVYFESSFGGSEYRLSTKVQGDITSSEFSFDVDEDFFFQIVTLNNESASVNHRAMQSQWHIGANRYRIQDGFLYRSFKDGQPSRLDTEWRVGGTIWRDGQRLGSISSDVVDDLFNIHAQLPDKSLLLESIPLTQAAAAGLSRTPSTPQPPTDDRRFSDASPLDPNEAVRIEQALFLYKQIGLDEDSAQEMIALVGTGDDAMIALTITAARFFVLDNDYENTLDLLKGTLAVLDEPEGEYAAALHNEVGKVRYYLGDIDQAFADFQRALDYYQEVEYPEQQAVVLAHLGLVYEAQTDYEAALTAYLEAIDLQEGIQKQAAGAETETLAQSLMLFRLPTNLGALYSNLGSLYHMLGESAKAEAAYLNALTIRSNAVDRGGTAAVLHNLGRLYSDLGRLDDALERLQTALEIAQSLNDVRAQGHILRSLGEIYGKQDAHDRALQHYDEALKRFRETGNMPSRGSVLNSMGLVHFDLEQYEQAAEYFQEALVIFEDAGYREDQATALSNLGIVQERQGNRTQALALYRDAIDVMESIQGELHVDEVKSAFLANQNHLYAYFVDLLWQEGDQLEALAYAERARARTFLELLGNPQVDIQRQADNALVEQAEATRHELLRLQNALSAERAKALDQQDELRLAELHQALETARSDYEQLLVRLKLSSPEYAAFMQVETLSVNAIQEEILDNNTTLIEYFVLEEHTLAWIIDNENVTPIELAIGRRELHSQISFLRDIIAEQDFDSELTDALYHALISPLAPYINQANLIIVPHDVLHYLPFAALWDSESDRYLAENFTITYAPTASALEYILKKHNANTGRLLTLGNPDNTLPNAAAEVRTIAQLYETTPLISSQATESQIYDQARQTDIIHLAAHSVYNPVNPLFSRIELAADSQHDGNLEVHEIFGLNLTDANLVVLSACETAMGAQNDGDEILGLTRAFLYAGAPSVVTSLWNVNDESTAHLMKSFYTYLRNGIGTADALRKAQLDTLAEYPEPYHWAAFTLHGDGGWVDVPAVSVK